MAQLTISFIVPTLNAERFLDCCLKSIRTQMAAGDELIVVDNGSSDRTVPLARELAATHIEIHPGLTVAALRNVGAANASGSLLAFVDSDCLLIEGWRSAVDNAMTDATVAASGSMPEVAETATWVERAWGSLKYRHRRQVHYIPAMNFIIRRANFETIQGFEGNLVTDEDTDLCLRLIRSGGMILEDPQIAAIHLGNPKSLKGFWTKERWHATSILASMARNGVDRPMVMTFSFMGSVLISLIFLAGFLIGKVGLVAVLLPILLVPVVTTLYRTWQYRNFRYIPALVLLYFLFYLIRSSVVIEQFSKRSHEPS